MPYQSNEARRAAAADPARREARRAKERARYADPEYQAKLKERQRASGTPECRCENPTNWGLSAEGVCPKCRERKFIGHGPLCGDCYRATHATP